VLFLSKKLNNKDSNFPGGGDITNGVLDDSANAT